MSQRLAVNEIEHAVLSPATRAGLETYLALGELVGPPVSREAWDQLPDEAQHSWEAIGIRVAQAYSPHPAMLRWCTWPNCPRSYDAVKGPSEHGWARRTREPLCPTHDALGHHPGYAVVDSQQIATCSCGARTAVDPTTWGAMIDWWGGHVREVVPDA